MRRERENENRERIERERLFIENKKGIGQGGMLLKEEIHMRCYGKVLSW